MQFPEIHFGGDNPKLSSYKKYYWQPGETRIVEFYPGKNTPVTLLYSSDPSLFEKLSTLIDGNPISIDLEWAPPNRHSDHPVELFQFSSSKGTIIVATNENKGYDQIAQFLHISPFFGKGMSCDKKKLRECTGENFDQIEDIEHTRLSPNNLPLNFESLTKMFLGEGTAKFKDHKVQVSDWSERPLTIQQILYGAHDSYAMLNVYAKIIEKYGSEIKQSPVKTSKKKANKKSKGSKAPNVNRKCEFVDIDNFFLSKKMSVNFVLENIESIEDEKPSLKHLLFEYESKKGVSVSDEDSCYLEHANDALALLLPSKPKEKRSLCLERIELTGDLFLLGVLHSKKDGTFMCEACVKHLRDPFAVIQHSELRHLLDPSCDHNLDPKDVLLHYLVGTKKVKCPFTIFFEESKMKNMKKEEDDESESESESDSDGSESDNSAYEIVPITYNQSDGISCEVCKMKFESVDELKNHCWLTHEDIFVKIVTGKNSSKEKNGEDEKKQLQFAHFCINQLHLANINDDSTINCHLCKTSVNSLDKFFNHASSV